MDVDFFGRVRVPVMSLAALLEDKSDMSITEFNRELGTGFQQLLSALRAVRKHYDLYKYFGYFAFPAFVVLKGTDKRISDESRLISLTFLESVRPLLSPHAGDAFFQVVDGANYVFDTQLNQPNLNESLVNKVVGVLTEYLAERDVTNSFKQNSSAHVTHLVADTVRLIKTRNLTKTQQAALFHTLRELITKFPIPKYWASIMPGIVGSFSHVLEKHVLFSKLGKDVFRSVSQCSLTLFTTVLYYREFSRDLKNMRLRPKGAQTEGDVKRIPYGKFQWLNYTLPKIELFLSKSLLHWQEGVSYLRPLVIEFLKSTWYLVSFPLIEKNRLPQVLLDFVLPEIAGRIDDFTKGVESNNPRYSVFTTPGEVMDEWFSEYLRDFDSSPSLVSFRVETKTKPFVVSRLALDMSSDKFGVRNEILESAILTEYLPALFEVSNESEDKNKMFPTIGTWEDVEELHAELVRFFRSLGPEVTTMTVERFDISRHPGLLLPAGWAISTLESLEAGLFYSLLETIDGLRETHLFLYFTMLHSIIALNSARKITDTFMEDVLYTLVKNRHKGELVGAVVSECLEALMETYHIPSLDDLFDQNFHYLVDSVMKYMKDVRNGLADARELEDLIVILKGLLLNTRGEVTILILEDLIDASMDIVLSHHSTRSILRIFSIIVDSLSNVTEFGDEEKERRRIGKLAKKVLLSLSNISVGTEHENVSLLLDVATRGVRVLVENKKKGMLKVAARLWDNVVKKTLKHAELSRRSVHLFLPRETVKTRSLDAVWSDGVIIPAILEFGVTLHRAVGSFLDVRVRDDLFPAAFSWMARNVTSQTNPTVVPALRRVLSFVKHFITLPSFDTYSRALLFPILQRTAPLLCWDLDLDGGDPLFQLLYDLYTEIRRKDFGVFWLVVMQFSESWKGVRFKFLAPLVGKAKKKTVAQVLGILDVEREGS